ncbi:tRNA ligase [Cryptotrichosporon argae]
MSPPHTSCQHDDAPSSSRTHKHPASAAALMSSLTHLRSTNPKAVRSSVHLYPASLYAPGTDLPDRRITSWKMTEHMYAKADNPFPTLARGLFTEHAGGKDHEAGRGVRADETGEEKVPQAARGSYDGMPVEDRIVARGYDKFFNVGETAWTEWDAIARHTEPPYYLTLKSNGCLILISALDPEHLLVASKHSLGTTTEAQADTQRGHKDKQHEDKQHEDKQHTAEPRHDGKHAQAGPSQQAHPRHVPGTRQADSPHTTRAPKSQAAEVEADEPAEGVEHLEVDGQAKAKNQKKREAKSRAKAERKEAAGKERTVDPAAQMADHGKGKSNTAEDGDEKEHGEAKVHAEVGRTWVRRTLAKSRKTETELARRLWDENLTAVLELCDDSFEEHVIATPAHFTGLHLHGLNLNTPHFSTLPPAAVSAFAADFGFIPTKYVELDSVDAVRRFTDDVAKTGAWEGDMIEGFVVRATVRDAPGPGAPPYRPRAPFFWKIKFDEPYLLYRQWREVTRVMLDLLPAHGKHAKPDEVWKRVRTKAKRPEVGLYAEWVGQRIKDEPALFDNYDTGVVRVRERFLAWTEAEGEKEWAAVKAGRWKMSQDGGGVARAEAKKGLPKKYLIVPIAIPGTGKTAIGVALAHLFGFGHRQSDDVTAKKSAPTFLRNIVELFRTHDVVYADRNNHLAKHYNELHDIAANTCDKNLRFIHDHDVRLVALAWNIERHPHHRVLRVCADRVVARGENHQTLRPAAHGGEHDHEIIVGSFLRNYESADLELFDATISVELLDDPRTALVSVIDGLVDVLKLKRPSEQEIDKALDAAKAYRATPRATEMTVPAKRVRYYGLAPELDLSALAALVAAQSMADAAAASARQLVERLGRDERFTKVPHVTLAHEANVAQEKALLADASPGPEERAWDACKRVADGGGQFEFDVVRAVWDDRLMALLLSPLRAGAGTAPLALSDTTTEYLHVTVGTVGDEVRGFESRGVIRRAREAEREGKQAGEAGEAVEGGGQVWWVDIEPVNGEGRVKGMW